MLATVHIKQMMAQSILVMVKWKIVHKLFLLVNFLLLTKLPNHNINHMIDSKHLAVVNFFAVPKRFTNARLDCTLHYGFLGVSWHVLRFCLKIL